MKPGRRRFMASFLLGMVIPAIIPVLNKLAPKTSSRLQRLLRPPGALEESEFLKACIGCGECANVCPNQCISLYGLEGDLSQLITPKISARSKGCILCMACTQVCPTAALTKLEPTAEGKRAVKMGTAVLTRDLCFSWAEPSRTCGVCYRACPLPGEAMTIGLYERPTIHPDKCVGCGLCEQACIHMPQAIRIIPRAEAS
jgi:ferredoxin-type protein NapG